MYVKDAETEGSMLGQFTHRSQNVTLQGETTIATCLRLFIRVKTREDTLSKRCQRSCGTWIPHHLFPHNVEDHVSQDLDLEKVTLIKTLVTTRNSLHTESF